MLVRNYIRGFYNSHPLAVHLQAYFIKCKKLEVSPLQYPAYCTPTACAMEQHVASTGLALALLVAAMGLYLMTRRKYMLPPGPKGLPIIGNTFNMPTNFEWLAYQKWSRDFSKAYSFVCISVRH